MAEQIPVIVSFDLMNFVSFTYFELWEILKVQKLPFSKTELIMALSRCSIKWRILKVTLLLKTFVYFPDAIRIMF